MKRRSIALIMYGLVVLFFCLGLTGCGNPYSIKRVGHFKLFEKRHETALNSSHPSQATMQFLRLRFLTQQYEDDPASCASTSQVAKNSKRPRRSMQ